MDSPWVNGCALRTKNPRTGIGGGGKILRAADAAIVALVRAAVILQTEAAHVF